MDTTTLPTWLLIALAVAGPAVGAAIAVFGVWLTGVQARKAEQAAWLRNERLDAYRTVLRQYEEFTTKAGDHHYGGESVSTELDEALRYRIMSASTDASCLTDTDGEAALGLLLIVEIALLNNIGTSDFDATMSATHRARDDFVSAMRKELGIKKLDHPV